MGASIEDDQQFSNEEQAFYNTVRGLVVVFLFFVILLVLAHITLRYFVARSDTVLDRTDRLIHRIVCSVCTFTLTITLAVYSLLPFSIFANEVLLSFPTSVYVQWLNTELVHDLALLVHYGTKILCLVVPFAYFLLNSHGFHGRDSAFGSRLLEAVILTGLSYILVFGTIWSFKSFISALVVVIFGNSTTGLQSTAPETHPVALLMTAVETLTWSEFIFVFLIQTFVHSLTSIQLVATFIGLLLLFIYMPIGLVNLTFHLVSVGFQSLPDLTRKSRVEEKLLQLQMEALCMKDDIETAFLLSRKTPMWYESLALTLPIAQSMRLRERSTTDAVGLLDQLHSRLPELRQEIQELQNRLADRFTLRLKETIRPLAPVALLILISCMLRLMESFVFFNILDLVRKLVFGEDSFTGLTKFSFWNVEKHSQPSSGFTLGHKPVSVFGHVGALLQVCVIQFLLCASLWGFHATPSTRFLRPRPHAVDLNRLLAHVTLLLLFTSALPLQTNLLGLTSLTLPSALKLSSVYDTAGAFSRASNSDGPLAVVDASKVILCGSDSCQPDYLQPVSEQSWSLWKALACRFSIASVFSPDVCPSNPQKSTFAEKDPPPVPSPSIFAQFMARAFGSSPVLSSVTPPPSYGSVFITLLYNLCFLATSVYVACLRLNDPIFWLVSKVFTSLRYCPHVSLSTVQLHSNDVTGKHFSEYRRSLSAKNLSSA